MKAADTIEIRVLVDNATDSLSSNPPFVETEWAGLRHRGMKLLSGKCLCCAAHGLSYLITARSGSASHALLFDTGPDDSVFERNVRQLGVDPGTIEAMVLSHGHWDHSGAMPRALQMTTLANGGRRVPTYMHPEMFALRATQSRSGKLHTMEPVPSADLLAANGAEVIVTRDGQSLLDDLFYVSGEIPRVSAFERGFPGQVRQTASGDWEADEILPDERFVAVNVAGKGQVVFSACSHAGLINVLTEAKARFPDIPLYGVFGGFHLSGGTESIIPETVEALAQFDLKLIAPGHCTGWRALSALAAAYGDRVVPTAVGKTFRL
jgi:7,8-dihydropterin-6-yl-methyl-4-(beta-D-ribofuranosyl)aminobenzene 5'-phosphate synthase